MDNPNTQTSKICPTCGSRAAQSATRCLVCGTSFDEGAEKKGKPRRTQAIRGSRMPEFTLSLPVILILFVVLLVLGGGSLYLILNATGNITEPTPIPTDTLTPMPSHTSTPATPTITFTPAPTNTPLTYFVQPQDTCGGIAGAFNISIQSLILQNNLSADCPLFEGQELKIPHPTATITPIATNTPSDVEATRLACETIAITIQEGDTLSLLSEVHGVPLEAIMEWNGKTVDTAFLGETVYVPICMRGWVPGIGTTTPTVAPPYPAPELLRPRNGEAYSLDTDTVSLQWGSVGVLRENEFYQVTVIDLTGGENQQLVAEVKDTKFVVPTSMRPTDDLPHAFEWFVVPVAQIGVSEDGEPIYQAGGPVSTHQVFIWVGSPSISTTPTP